MAHWSDSYVGQPYLKDEFDCAGLAELVRREQFGHELTLPKERLPGTRGRNRQIADLRDDYAERVSYPSDGDGVLLICRGYAQHIGVACIIDGELWVLHNAMDAKQVVRQRARELRRYNYTIEGYYKWK